MAKLSHVTICDNVSNKSPSDNKMYGFLEKGVVNNIHIVDTTGAGDSYIAGYMLSHFFLQDSSSSFGESFDGEGFKMSFASWVASLCIGGIGRSALPVGTDVDCVLGTDSSSMSRRLLQIFEETMCFISINIPRHSIQ